jgi:hypothetical protein
LLEIDVRGKEGYESQQYWNIHPCTRYCIISTRKHVHYRAGLSSFTQ